MIVPTSSDEDRTDIRELPEVGDYPCLEILSGPKGSGRFYLKKGKNEIGRSNESTIVLDDSSVSRKHALIEVAEQGTATLTDLGSRNGTKIGDRKIEKSVSLDHGAKIKIGLYQLRYLTRSPEASGKTPVNKPLPPPPAEEVPPTESENLPVVSEAPAGAFEEIPPPQSGRAFARHSNHREQSCSRWIDQFRFCLFLNRNDRSLLGQK